MADVIYDRRSLKASEVKGERVALPDPIAAFDSSGLSDPVLRMVVNRDDRPTPMGRDALAALGDPFALMVLHAGLRPQSVDATLARLDAASAMAEFADAAVPEQLSFVVGEGGQIPFSDDTATLARALRFVVARRGGQGEDERLVMMSIDERPGSPDGLMQVLAWDPVKKAYNFYQRRDGVWFHSGDSYDALDPPSRGFGPFDGHVNGSLVMKELRRPWLHWTSQAVSIPREAFAPGHPILTHSIYRDATGAEMLEDEIIVPGIERWTRARLDRSIANGHITEAYKLLRQVVETTTVNIIASDREFAEIAPGVGVNVPYEILLNLEFWARRDILAPLTIRGRISVDGEHYLAALEAHGIALSDPGSGFRQPGDAFFAFACPSPAYEDLSVVFGLIEAGVLSRRLARALMSVDFCNPIQSARRARFTLHLPREGALGTGPGSVEAAMITSIAAAAQADPASDEALVMEQLETGDEAAHRSELSAQIAGYLAAVQQRVGTADGVLDLVRLIDSRRRYFRSLGVSEFALTLPSSNIPDDAPFLTMTSDGLVVEAAPPPGA